MRFDTIIFDLDGTLVDSLPGIELSARFAAEQCVPDRVLPSMRALIGPPIATMFARLWPDLETSRFDALVAAFRGHYNTIGCRHSEPFPGVVDGLRLLADRGVAMHVLTNKPLAPTRTILEATGIRERFRDIMSPDAVGAPFVRKSEGAATLRQRYALQPGRTLIVGDGLDDMEAAQACGFAFIVAGYGYGSAAAARANEAFPVVKSFSELLALVL